MFIKVNCSRSLANNLIPTGSYIENKDLWFKERKFFSIDLNCLIDSTSHMLLSNFFHSQTLKEKKECLKLSVRKILVNCFYMQIWPGN